MIDQEQQQKIIVFILLFIGGVFFLFSLLFFISRSELSDIGVDDTNISAPEEVVVSNVTGNSATISWYSSTSARGFVKFGKTIGSINTSAFNTRDPSGQQQARNIHYVRVTNLSPSSDYFVEIYLNDTKFDNSGQYYKLKTLSNSNVGTPDTLLVSLPSTFTEGVVYAHASDGSTVSTTSSNYASSTSASIDLSVLKDENGQSFKLETSTGIKVSATSLNGTRFEKIITGDSTRAIIESSKTGNLAYEPRSVFSIVASNNSSGSGTGSNPTGNNNTTPTTNTNTEIPTTTPVPINTTNTNNTTSETIAQNSSTTLTATSGTLGAVTQIPATSIEPSDLFSLLQLALGGLLLFFGYRLAFKKN